MGNRGWGWDLSPNRCRGGQVCSTSRNLGLRAFGDPSVLLLSGVGVQKARNGCSGTNVPRSQRCDWQGLYWTGQRAQGGSSNAVWDRSCSGEIRDRMFRQRKWGTWDLHLVGAHSDLRIPQVGWRSARISAILGVQRWRTARNGVADEGRQEAERDQVRRPQLLAVRISVAGDWVAQVQRLLRWSWLFHLGSQDGKWLWHVTDHLLEEPGMAQVLRGPSTWDLCQEGSPEPSKRRRSVERGP